LFFFGDLNQYQNIFSDTSLFKNHVEKHEDSVGHFERHSECCKNSKRYICVKKFIRNPIFRNIGKQKVECRVLKCKECGELFYIIPSFILPRLHYGADIVSDSLESRHLNQDSERRVLNTINKTLPISEHVKSSSTLLSWENKVGIMNPAEVLIACGVEPPKYCNEDEKFLKTCGERSYTIGLVENKSGLVWLLEYTRSIGIESFFTIFTFLLTIIGSSIKGLTKDGWEWATVGIKQAIKYVRIQLCLGHRIEKACKLLFEQFNKTELTDSRLIELLKALKEYINRSIKGDNLRYWMKQLRIDYPEFSKDGFDEFFDKLIENSKYYTAYKNMSGLSKTTVWIDQIFKSLERKMVSMYSMRKDEWAKVHLHCWATVHNFHKYCSGSKNAHKSPVEIEGLDLKNIPWFEFVNIKCGKRIFNGSP
jgi:hypothetical protein